MTSKKYPPEVRTTLLIGAEGPRVLTSDIEAAHPPSPVDSSLSSYLNSERSRFFGHTICLISTVIILVVISASLLYAKIRFTPSPSKLFLHAMQPSEWAYCGNTTAKAHANGYVYDLIAGAWVPPACFDRELENEFLGLSNWQWFSDFDRTQEMSLDSLKKTGGPKTLYVSTGYHIQHCVFTWKKLHRAVIHKKPIDTQIGRYGHTEHCTMALAANLSGTAEFHTIFTGCKLPDDPDLNNGTALQEWANLI